jgi:hypothetical protein
VLSSRSTPSSPAAAAASQAKKMREQALCTFVPPSSTRCTPPHNISANANFTCTNTWSHARARDSGTATVARAGSNQSLAIYRVHATQLRRDGTENTVPATKEEVRGHVTASTRHACSSAVLRPAGHGSIGVRSPVRLE